MEDQFLRRLRGAPIPPEAPELESGERRRFGATVAGRAWTVFRCAACGWRFAAGVRFGADAEPPAAVRAKRPRCDRDSDYKEVVSNG